MINITVRLSAYVYNGEPIIAIHRLIKCIKQPCTDIFNLIISSVDIYLPNQNRSYSQRLRGVLTSQC